MPDRKHRSSRRHHQRRREEEEDDDENNHHYGNLTRVESTLSSLYMEDAFHDPNDIDDTSCRDLKKRESEEVTVRVSSFDDFDIADFDLEEEDDENYNNNAGVHHRYHHHNSNKNDNNNDNDDDNNNNNNLRTYSCTELVATLGNDSNQIASLHPTLQQRVRDFRFAQRKRREKHGTQKPWGIFGLYAHLADIRIDLEWSEDAAWRRENGEPYLSWADYEKARNKGINRPFFTYMTMLVCTVMMIVIFSLNNWKIEPLSVNPLIGPSAEVLIEAGARETSLIVNEGQWFRLISPLVLHAGIIHFVINMLALWFIGAAVEQSHGFASAAILFFIPAVGGNILSAIFLPQYISVGASGGIFGLIGGCIADIILNWKLLFIKGEHDDGDQRWRHYYAFFWLFFDIIINCLIGLTPFVDNFTHLGGLLYGLCCGISTIERLAVAFFGASSGKFSTLRNGVIRFCGLIFSVFLIMVTTILLVESDGVTSPCPSCRYASCVPFPFWAEYKWWNCDDCDFAVADLIKLHADSDNYDRIDLTCPSGEVTLIDVTNDLLSDREQIRRDLPKYCRSHCESVFAHN